MKVETNKYYLFGLLFLWGFCIYGQSLNNLRHKKIFASTDTIELDSMSIIPGSFKVLKLDSSTYKLLALEGKMVLLKPLKDSVEVEYKVYPLLFTRNIKHRTRTNKGVDFTKSVNPFSIKSQSKNYEDIFGGSSLTKGGSISRGLSFGNNQDVSVFSNMNLQLAGSVQGVEILAAITDNDIPIQPEGNSQQLQDFDKVFVQFSKDNHKLIAGDFQITEKKDKYLKLNKKAQGLSYYGLYKTSLGKQKFDYKVSVDGALSRGKFSRNVIIGEEGNQGPYQLRGAENEQFIIVLSGTEKIFIDGKLMKRGIDNDYVIDYNTGEVTFTTNQLITKDKRITSEFQYSDRYYGRTLFKVGNLLENKKMKFHFNFFSEQDMKFQQLQQSLSQEDINILALAGDSINNAVISSVDTVEYTSSLVLYAQRDSIVENVNYPYFQHSSNPDSAIYQLSFSYVGFGNGNYTLAKSTANGRVYTWEAPVGGLAQGDYEPVIQLVAPKQQQMATIGGELKLSKRTKLEFGGAWSKKDVNLFSSNHKEDDQGFSLHSKFDTWKPVGKKSKGYQVGAGLNYQLINQNFTSIQRFRSVEFERDWNVNSSLPVTDEHSGGVQFYVKKRGKERLKINSSIINRGESYQGYKNAMKFGFPLWDDAKIKGTGSYLITNGGSLNSQFLRHNIKFDQKLRIFTIQLWEEQEQNKLIDDVMDTLRSNSFNYKVLGSSFQIGSKNKSNFKIQYDSREDQLVKNNALKTVTFANNYGGTLFLKKRSQSFKWNATFRELQIRDKGLTHLKSENTLLNRIDFKFRLWKGMITSSSFIEVATGNELKKEFSYVEVPAGQGVYVWNDYNTDSIQQLNEFEIAQFSDQAKFIRLYQPTNEFIKTYSNQLNQTLLLNPAKFFKRNTRFKKFITRFSDQAYLKLKQKLSKSQDRLVQLPFQNSVNDTSLISINSSLRNSFYFNRSNPVFGADYSIRQTQSKSLLVDGFLGRELLSHAINIRWNVVKNISIQSKVEQQEKSRSSELFSSNDYEIKVYAIEPKIVYQKSTNFRITFKGAYKEKKNLEIFGGEFSIFSKLGTEVTYNLPKKGRMNAAFNYIDTKFIGNEGETSPLSFDMLEGLQIGTNFTWQVQYRHTFKNNLQLNLSYQGRSSENNPVIHTGSAQVQMLF